MSRRGTNATNADIINCGSHLGCGCGDRLIFGHLVELTLEFGLPTYVRFRGHGDELQLETYSEPSYAFDECL